MIQDLRTINVGTIPPHPLVVNPYNILVQAPGDAKCFTVLDLKDAFFCIPVHKDSQYLSAFEWTNSNTS